MTNEQEREIRADAQKRAVNDAIQSFIDQYVILSGELAVANAKIAELEKDAAKQDIINP